MEPSSEIRPVSTAWSAAQTYTMAVICLVIGLAIGYFVRGSASPATSAPIPVQSPQALAPAGQKQPMPTLADMKRMADKQAEPLITKLKSDPKDVSILNKTAVTYKAGHQFDEAIKYFQKALAIDPSNVPIRTDMASCMYFTGNVDGAISELEKSLTYDPKHAGTLMNLGIIKWKGKDDVSGAVASWEKLLKLNPNFPQKEQIEHLISQAQQQQSSGEPPKSPKG
jgi:tetratricopeptide (TPR) repeat protein